MKRNIIVLLVAVVVVAGAWYLSSQSTTAPQVSDLPEPPSDTTMQDDGVSHVFEFEQAAYQEALDQGKLVVLYFYANWCPICKAEFPNMQEAFSELGNDQVIGFRVHFNDNQVTQEQKDLAREFGIAYQHTKVFVKNGEQILKAPDSWEKQRYLDEISNQF